MSARFTRPSLISTRLVCLILTAAVGFAPSIGPDPGIHTDGADESHVEEHMEVIQKSVKRLRRSLRDVAQRDQSLELLATMERATIACKELAPPMAGDIPETERAAFVLAFRRALVELLEAQVKLELAVIDGDSEAVNAAFAHLRSLEGPGHERFAQED